ncbi:MAG TPA: hypothetical protein DCQ06_03320 [Myxococcales bacterium]|nr:hypothetical protein [Myxococcales bacterium]
MQLGPADVDGGFRPDNQDSWGGALVKGDDGLFHMWVSVVANGCTIDLWARNSMTVYATASDPMGPYQWQNEAFPVMSHEVDVKRAPDGSYVAFLTAGLDDEGYVAESDLGEACQCDETTGKPIEPCQTAASTERSVMVTAKSPAGPWSKATVLLDPTDLDDGIDANFSADILPDGRLIGLWRTYPANQAGRGASVVHWVVAKDYRDPNTYEWQNDKESLFAAPRDGSVAEGLEDMFVWYDNQRKVAHALFHDMIEREDGVSFDALGHAWSTDGKAWTYTGMAADGQVPLSDGTQTTSARARPHGLVLDGKLTYLSFAENALINGRNYTMVQALQSVEP